MGNRFSELTAFETSMAERAAGQSIEALADEEGVIPKVGLHLALAWVAAKRDEPTLTYEQYGQRVTYQEALEFLFGGDEEPEVPAGEEGPFRAEGDASALEGSGADEGALLPADGHRAV